MLTYKGLRVKPINVLIILVVLNTLPITVNSTENNNSNPLPLAFHKFWLSPLTSEVYSFDCEAGDILEGSFTVTIDGDLFIYDQTKYDLWVGWGAGVDLYIFDEQSYQDWSEGLSAIPLFTEKDLTDFSWRIDIPETGRWYVVYDNDSSVYGKQVEGTISHTSRSSTVMLGLIAIAAAALVLVLGFALKRR
ncbi:MAG: hypothetical protein ACFFAZ_01130 [Promethearchaeota archaeon]